MKVEYTDRAIADLRKISADSRAAFGDRVASSLEARIQAVVSHIAEHPEAAPRVVERPGMRMFPLIRYPYRIFYRVLDDRVRILHIRHTSRRPWIREV
jgi:plasmid stabilization system protein ParE